MADTKDKPKPPPPLPSSTRLLLSLSALCSTLHPASPPPPITLKWYQATSSAWLKSVLKLLEIDAARLPPAVDVERVRSSAEEQRADWTDDEKVRMAGVLVEASLAVDAEKEKKEQALRYTPIARALSHRTLNLLGLPAKDLLPEAEKNLSSTLFTALKAAQENETAENVESTRAAHSQGWGGSFGRSLATGAGVVAGGILIGVTGGLAAPAIAAVLAPLGISGLLAGGAAPIVLGTLFGVGGGGLAGRRVRERWKGVEEFGFIEVGDGTKATKEEIADLQEAKKKYRERKEQEKADNKKAEAEMADKAGVLDEKQAIGDEKTATGEKDEVDEKDLIVLDEKSTPNKTGETTETEEASEEEVAEAAKEVQEDRDLLEEKLLHLSLAAGTRTSISSESGSARPSLGSPRPSLDQGEDDKSITTVKKPPSLTATIVVPGLLTVSRTEAITAWRSICSSQAPVASSLVPPASPPEKEGVPAQSTLVKTGFEDGRDVYLLRYESVAMLKTGRDIDMWVGSKIKDKIKGKIKMEIIKRTALSAYFAAVALPRTVYGMATMTLDNTWIQAQDRARKAGQILGEVLEKRVQGERPVVLIGSSLGALTVLEAMLYLASLPPPPRSQGAVPAYVESAYLISLPAAPSVEEWAKCRSVTARRLVNAWSSADWVLAGVVRLHEVVTRAATLQSGLGVAGLGPIAQPGVEDIDLSAVVEGHMELQTKMGDVMRVINVDA